MTSVLYFALFLLLFLRIVYKKHEGLFFLLLSNVLVEFDKIPLFISNKKTLGVRVMAHQLRTLVALQRTWVCFLAPTWWLTDIYDSSPRESAIPI